MMALCILCFFVLLVSFRLGRSLVRLRAETGTKGSGMSNEENADMRACGDGELASCTDREE